MSVLKSQRGESTVQFLGTARELEIYTIKTCAKFPKRYMFLITKDIVALASAVYNNAKAANSIYVTTADDARLRREYVTKANCTFATMYDSTKYPGKTGEINVFAKGACNLSRKGQTKTPMWSIGRYLHCRLLRYIGLMVGITCNRNPQLYFDCTGFNFDL